MKNFNLKPVAIFIALVGLSMAMAFHIDMLFNNEDGLVFRVADGRYTASGFGIVIYAIGVLTTNLGFIAVSKEAMKIGYIYFFVGAMTILCIAFSLDAIGYGIYIFDAMLSLMVAYWLHIVTSNECTKEKLRASELNYEKQ